MFQVDLARIDFRAQNQFSFSDLPIGVCSGEKDPRSRGKIVSKWIIYETRVVTIVIHPLWVKQVRKPYRSIV
jgi:hypothetical protein